VRRELSERQGAAYDPDRYPDAVLRQQVLDEMIRDRLILSATRDMGLRAGDRQVQAAIQAIPAFQVNGKFDMDSFNQALRYQGLSPIQFEQQVRGSLMTSQLSQMVNVGEFMTRGEVAEAQRLLYQQRRFDYFVVPASSFTTLEPPVDDDVKAYYDENQAMFRSPERVKVEYLVLDSQAVTAEQAPEEEELHRIYESRKAGYGTPEQRQARHILITVPADADGEAEAAAKAKLAAIRDRIVAGEDFGDLAKEASEDPGSAPLGGDLGFFGTGMMDPAFETAAFSQQEGEVGEPVRSAFGYHLIQVTAIKPGSTKSFEEVRDELVRLAGRDEAERRFFEMAERFEGQAYEHPDSLEPAAESLGLGLQKTDWLTREGGEGEFADPKVMNAAFSDQVLREGFNSDPVQIDDDAGHRIIVVRMLEHEESSLKPLDEVRDIVVGRLSAEMQRDAATARANELADALRDGQDAAALAAEYGLKSVGPVKRNDVSVPSSVVQSAFSLAPPVSDGVSVGTAGVPQGTAVVVVREVIDGKPEDSSADQRDAEGLALSRALARAYYDKLVDYLRSQAEVIIHKTADES
jgi:peptidyl-prolyl cis-trans isomerase D